jgi:EAL domain-containing protein (putative c-di-GMP-specific phosphodiesterase class I)
MAGDEKDMGAAAEVQPLSDLAKAVPGGQLRLAYQPILSLETLQVVGVEALIRWQHPVRGLVPPAEFIPVAERDGLILDIGAWVLQEACRQGAAWAALDPGAHDLHMSVNVSARQMAPAAGLVASVQQALNNSGLDPSMLGLEVTESALTHDPEAALRVVKELKELNVQISVDDFGTGGSTWDDLSRFPVDALKIDRSFVAGLGQSDDDAMVVRSIIDLARDLDIIAIAEGIETRGQLAALQSYRCGFGQGYLWSPGRPAADLGPTLFQAAADSGRRA